MKLFPTGPANHSGADIILLITRVTISGLMLTHGWPKLMKFFSGEPLTFGDPLGVGVVLSLSLAVFSEVICSLLIIIGWKTRWVVIPLILTMLVAAFIVHADDPFKKQELPILYCCAYLLLFFTGSGRYSIDYLTDRK